MSAGSILSEAWRVFFRDLGTYLAAALAAAVLTAVTLGILGGPLFAGLCRMILLRVREGRHPRAGDVFGLLERPGAFIVPSLVLTVLIVIGLLQLFVPGLVVVGVVVVLLVPAILLATAWFYVLPFMVDQAMSFRQAVAASRELVRRGSFADHSGMVALLGIIYLFVSAGFGVALSAFFRLQLGDLLGLLAMPFVGAAVVTMYLRGTAEAAERPAEASGEAARRATA
jgi:hypothetical protein